MYLHSGMELTSSDTRRPLYCFVSWFFFCHCYFGLLSNRLLTYKSDIMGQTQITTFLVLILGHLHNFRDRAISTGFELLKGGFIFLKGIG